jgi:hypothetical protein
MKTILALAALILFSWAAVAQNNCSAELQPLKPITTMGCADMAPACLCNPSGTSCHWIWACGSSGKTSEEPKRSGIDPSIPLRGRPLQMSDPMDTILQIEQLRQLQRQNAKPVLPTLPQRAPLQTADIASMKTAGNWNGRAWLHFFPDNHRWAYVDAVRETLTIDAPANVPLYFASGTTNGQIADAITSFYANDEHLWVPIHYALWAARLKLEGADSSKLEEYVSVLKEAFSENAK